MKTGRLFSLLFGAAVLVSGSVYAQARKPQVPLGPSHTAFTVKEKKMKQEAWLSPDITLKGVNKNFKPEKWMVYEVENFQLDVTDRARSALNIGKKDLYLGPLIVTFHFHVKDPNATGSQKLLLLSKSITYVDVPINKPTNFNVLLSPVTVNNLTGGTGNFRTERMGFEVKYADDVIYRWSDDKAKQDWWNIAAPGVTKADAKYPLLNKDETPFSIFWYDRYPSIKKVDSTALGETIQRLSTPEETEDEPATTPAPNRPRNTTGGRTLPSGTPR